MLSIEDYCRYAFFHTHSEEFHQDLVRLGSINQLMKQQIILLETLVSLNQQQSEALYQAAMRSETCCFG